MRSTSASQTSASTSSRIPRSRSTTSSKAIVTIDGTIEEKEMDQREEVQQDIIAAYSGIVDKTNDPVRMYLREMGTVKLLDRQGEVDIAKRIEKGERKVYKALSQNRIILEEILKIYESAKKDPRVIKEMIDLAMPEDETIAVATDENGEPKLPLAAVNKIADIMAIFEKVAKHDKKIKDAKAKLLDPKKLSRADAEADADAPSRSSPSSSPPNCARWISRRRRAIA